MNCEKIGKLLLQLRKEKGMTQKNLADALHLSDRTISKWERGVGCPDVSLLPELSTILGIDINNILSGDLKSKDMDGGNMRNIKFYVCPTCGNVLFSTSKAVMCCCGRNLHPLLVQNDAAEHDIIVNEIENDLFITFQHDMTKSHFISFVAYVSYDRVLFVKLYPEQAAQVRFPIMHSGVLYIYCTVHGLIKKKC